MVSALRQFTVALPLFGYLGLVAHYWPDLWPAACYGLILTGYAAHLVIDLQER